MFRNRSRSATSNMMIGRLPRRRASRTWCPSPRKSEFLSNQNYACHTLVLGRISFTICFMSILTCLKKCMPRFLFLKTAEIMNLETMTFFHWHSMKIKHSLFGYLVSILHQRSSQVNEEKTQNSTAFGSKLSTFPHLHLKNFQSNSRIPPFSLQLPPRSHPHPPPSTPPAVGIRFPAGFPGPFDAESSGADGVPGAWSAHQVIEVVGKWWRSRCVLEYGKTMGKSMGKTMQTMEKNKGQNEPTTQWTETNRWSFWRGRFFWNVLEMECPGKNFGVWTTSDPVQQRCNDATSPICGGPNPHLFYNSQSFPNILHSLKKSIR